MQEQQKSAGLSRGDRGAAHLEGKWVLLADLFEIINDLQWRAGGVLGDRKAKKTRLDGRVS